MKTTGSKNKFAARMIFALAGIFFAVTAVAQDDDQPQIEGRYLFIFGTSAEMKNRIPATETEINQLLSLSMNGALHTGDSIGIWTFDQTLRAGQFPLITWQPEDAVNTANAVNKFVSRQRYYGTNNFAALLPVLERVIQNSPRLTVLIFCDGSGEISGTPYDNDINPVFKGRFLEQKKTRQPFIVVLRMQLGKYAGSSVNFPPGMVNLPAFPPLPTQEPAAPPQPVVTNTPPPAPVEPLVIIGTKVETNWQAYHFAMTNVPETNSTSSETNGAPENPNAGTDSAALLAKTNPSANSISTTNAMASQENNLFDRKGTLALAAGFLIGAIALTAIFIFRPRRERGSLISRSMRK